MTNNLKNKNSEINKNGLKTLQTINLEINNDNNNYNYLNNNKKKSMTQEGE